MSLNIEGKKEVVAEVSERLKKAQTVVLAEFRGLKVEDITVLRGSLVDEAALHGILIKVRDLALPLLAVSRVPEIKKSD